MNDGLYQLVLRPRRDLTVEVGALGPQRFTAGLPLVYTGSARRGLAARVARHARRAKPLRWHIDYLTTHADIDVVWVWLLPGAWAPGAECRLNRATKDLPGVEIPARGFGAGDCRQGCGAHLLAVPGHDALPPPGPWTKRVEGGCFRSIRRLR